MDSFRVGNNFKKILNFTSVVELLCLSMGIVFAGWLIWANTCETQYCMSLRTSKQTFDFFVSFVLILFGILNSVQVWLMLKSSDEDATGRGFFYLGVFGLALNYLIFGLFFSSLNELSVKGANSSMVFFIQISIFACNILLLFKDSSVWELAGNGVKVRVSLALLQIIILLVSPALGLLSGLVIFPVWVLWPKLSKKEKN